MIDTVSVSNDGHHCTTHATAAPCTAHPGAAPCTAHPGVAPIILGYNMRLTLASVKGTSTVFSKIPLSLKRSRCLDQQLCPERVTVFAEREFYYRINLFNKI